ncbi:hypothetical protein OPW39_25730 [Vibrio europaeus]|uniref:hypothetical protein n=1 Tax=Vibrio europaeus TaxID=300876 RepID=UPI00233F6A02|nr:hypothetical protein [Vibrio europaeus]MDC5872207.1 hypothetical protein [Vibrio europaeus]
MKKLTALLLSLVLSPAALADPQGVDEYVQGVFSGYAEGIVFFKVNREATNPAKCSSTEGYAILPSQDTANAIPVLLNAMNTNKRLYVAVSRDVCYTSKLFDTVNTFPVAEYIGVQN